jgi:hypothetical protein
MRKVILKLRVSLDGYARAATGGMMDLDLPVLRRAARGPGKGRRCRVHPRSALQPGAHPMDGGTRGGDCAVLG